MSSDQSLNHRLINLARQLEQVPTSGIPATGEDANPIAARLEAVADERLRLLRETLQERLDAGELDAEDALLLHLLLEDYRAGVGHLRAVATSINSRLTAVRQTIKDGRRTAALERSQGDEPASEDKKT